MKNKHWFWLLLALTSLAFFLRVFQLSELFYFTHDEETIVWRIMPLLRDRNIFLLGGVTPLHVHLGPWFYYLSALILSIFRLNPLGWGIAAAIVGTATTALVLILGKKFFNARVGIIASLLYATSFLMVAFDRHWWPLVLNPVISLLVLFSLWQLVKKNYHYTVLLGLALALGFHSDPSTWGLAVLALVVWVKYKLPLRHKSVILGLAIFAASFLPLIAFDIKNQGTNLLAINTYLSETKLDQGLSLSRLTWTILFIPRSLGRLLQPTSTELTSSYAYCPEFSQGRVENAPVITTFIALITIVYFLTKYRQRKIFWIIGSYLLIIIIGINIYGNFFSSDLFDHYLTTLFPLFFFIVAFALDKLWKKRKLLAITITATLVMVNLSALTNVTNKYSFRDKTEAVNWTIGQLQGKSFALDSLEGCFRYSGIRYLFSFRGTEPALSFVDPNFFWLYSNPPATTYPDTLVVFVMHEDSQTLGQNPQYLSYLDKTKTRRQFGSLEVLIVDNTNTLFTIDP